MQAKFQRNVNPASHRRSLKWLWLLLFCILLTVGAAFAAVLAAVDLDRVPKGMNLGEWDIGGLRIEAFHDHLEARIDALLHQQIIIQSDIDEVKGASFTLKELGAAVQADKILTDLHDLQQGSWFERLRKHWAMRGSAYSFQVTVDEPLLEQALEAKWNMLTREPVPARRLINERDEVVYIPEVNAYRADLKQLSREVQAAILLHTDLPLAPPPPIILDLPIVTIRPPVTVESLRAEGIERKIAEFTTSYAGSSAGRVHNIEATASVINDMILAPGDIFDYEQIVAATEAEHGYREAPVIVNGRLVPGIGGGICQITSTLYNALLRTDLEIVERRNHSLPVGYVPLGLDATYATGWINFKFRNNTDAHLLIKAETKNHQLTIKLFGKMPSSITYEVSSKVVEIVPPPVKVVVNASLAPGQEQIIQKGKPGYIVETHRKVYEHGELVRTEWISRDTYRAQEQLVAVGPDGAERDQGDGDGSGSLPDSDADPDARPDTGPHAGGKEAPVEDGIRSTF